MFHVTAAAIDEEGNFVAPYQVASTFTGTFVWVSSDGTGPTFTGRFTWVCAEQRGQPGGFVGDGDVLDTWATSSLTPEIAGGLGCGDIDLFSRVYPFDLRPQAHDIIRTWLFTTVLRAEFARGSLPFRHASTDTVVMEAVRLGCLHTVLKPLGGRGTAPPLVRGASTVQVLNPLGADDRLLHTEARSRRRPRISRAALRPGVPITPPPGCVAAPHRYRPPSGVR